MTQYADIKIKCQQCGREFVVMEDELQFYKQKGLTVPRRCKYCRSLNHKKNGQLVCSECGFKIDRAVPVYCNNCHSSDIANSKLEYELKSKNMENAYEEICNKLKDTELERIKLEEALLQKEQRVGDLEKIIGELNDELGKVKRLHIAMEKWFQPALKSLEGNIGERIKSMEHEQQSVQKRLIQMDSSLQDIQKECQNLTLFKLIKNSFLNKN